MWGATRALVSATAVMFVALLFGLVGSPWAILALPVAYLIGLTFAAISMVMTATASTIGSINQFPYAVHTADVLGERRVLSAGQAA